MMTRRLALRGMVGRGEIIDRAAKRLGCTRVESKRLLDSVLGFIARHLRKRHRVQLTPFGIFLTRLRKPPATRSGASGSRQPVGNRGRRVVVFRPGKDLERRRRS